MWGLRKTSRNPLGVWGIENRDGNGEVLSRDPKKRGRFKAGKRRLCT